MRARRKIETPEQKDMRLVQAREYKRQKLQNKTPEDRQSAEQSESVSKTNDSKENEDAVDLTMLVENFYRSVVAGPLYVCTCCDQLWYKHSVFTADRIRVAHPDMATVPLAYILTLFCVSYRIVRVSYIRVS